MICEEIYPGPEEVDRYISWHAYDPGYKLGLCLFGIGGAIQKCLISENRYRFNCRVDREDEYEFISFKLPEETT